MLPDRALNILQVGTRDIGGGAEKVAWDLFQIYRAYGHRSWLAVGYKRSGDPDVFAIRNDQAGRVGFRLWWRMHQRMQPYYQRLRGVRLLCRLMHRLAEPGSVLDSYNGREDFHYPGTRRLPTSTTRPPDILHCHNLHGNYFDLRALPSLSHKLPVILTLHDAWLLSGHCAHSFDCRRWRTGCGKCPDLTIYPAIRRDATAFNWQRKRDIYARSRLHIATPCRWLMEIAKASMLAPAVMDTRIIPYGIDLSVFRPTHKGGAREALGIPQDASVLLFAAAGIRRNMWKDYETMRSAVARVGDRRSGRRVLFIALGESAPTERVGDTEVRFEPFTSDAKVVARYYQAADVYVHAALVETFPNAVLEALACGTPVVGTAVGGIPEQVKSLPLSAGDGDAASARHAAEEATGILVRVRDAEAMAAAIERLIGDDRLRRLMGQNAADDAHKRFDLRREADEYLSWYAELLGRPMSPERMTQTELPMLEQVR